MTRLTTTKVLTKYAQSSSQSFIDTWSDANTPTQTRLHDADGKRVRVIAENKVDALMPVQTGATEFLQVQNSGRFAMER